MVQTYRETLDYMFAQLPMYQQMGKSAYNAKLDNILAFAAHLGHPEKEFRSIHVGGTNGKGSSSHMLASILQEAGYKTGLYTSPHLKDFRERIKIDGRPVSEDFVVDFIQTHQSFFELQKLSFFEMTVGMAFDYFVQEQVDIAIIEVGLGGRLDSTNIIVPEVSLITNIGLDHVDILGDTLDKIAFEKAGIIKENIPIVISEYQKETAEVFETVAAAKNAPLTYADGGAEVDQARKTPSRKTRSGTTNQLTTDGYPTYKTSLLGDYQSKNVKGVVAVMEQLQNFKVMEKHIRNGLQNVTSNTGLMGRWQVLRTEPMVFCDTAHNREGLLLVLQQIVLEAEQQGYGKLHFVLGFVQEKNLDSVLPLFPRNAEYYYCRPNIPRGLDAAVLQEKAKTYELPGERYESVESAYRSALESADDEDFIFIGGSNFTVAEVL